jgi:hypothetical protein
LRQGSIKVNLLLQERTISVYVVSVGEHGNTSCPLTPRDKARQGNERVSVRS